jgi:hypothetical protein
MTFGALSNAAAVEMRIGVIYRLAISAIRA